MLNKSTLLAGLAIGLALVLVLSIGVFSVSAQGPGTGNGTPMPCDGSRMMNGGGMGMMMGRGGHHQMGHHANAGQMMNSEDCPMYQNTETTGTWWGWMEHMQLHLHNPELCPFYQATTAAQ